VLADEARPEGHDADLSAEAATSTPPSAVAEPPDVELAGRPLRKGLVARALKTPPAVVFLVVLGVSLTLTTTGMARLRLLDETSSTLLLTALGLLLTVVMTVVALVKIQHPQVDAETSLATSQQGAASGTSGPWRPLSAAVCGLGAGILVPLLFQVPVAPEPSACPAAPDAALELSRGQVLPSGDALTSRDGSWILRMQGDGRLSLCDTATGSSTWKAKLDGEPEPGSFARLRKDGNFVVYSQDGSRILWQTHTDNTDAEAVVVEGSGRAALTGRGTPPLWVTDGIAPVTEAFPPSSPNELKRWEVLAPETSLTSPNGRYALTMQKDGALLLHSGDQVLWEALGTRGYYNSALAMQHDGNLVVWANPNDPEGMPVWSSETDERGADALRIEDSGRLALYDGPRIVSVIHE
jgi:hypothetical protein